MQGASTHGALRIILTIVGLNGLVVVVWLLLRDIVGPAGSLRAGSPESPPRLRADWPGSAGMWFDWLVMLAIFGAFLVIAARRIWGPVGTSAPSSDSLEDASIPDDEDVGSQPEGSMSPPRRSSRHDEAYALPLPPSSDRAARPRGAALSACRMTGRTARSKRSRVASTHSSP